MTEDKCKAADLHAHTTASDGLLTPYQLLELARKTGLTTVGITDHDTVDGLEQLAKAPVQDGPELVPGIELNTDWEGCEVHILGYYIDYNSPVLLDQIRRLGQGRRHRAEEMVARLVALGMEISYRRVAEIAGSGTVGRPHIAQALREAGYVKSVAEAFERYIGLGRPAYVPRNGLQPEQAVKLVLTAGGVPVLAHPGLVGRNDLIERLIKEGLLGLEVYYPLHTPGQTKFFEEICRRHGLVMTGGSDFHGSGSGYPPLGTVAVPQITVDRLKQLKTCQEKKSR